MTDGRHYVVSWTVDILDASSPEEAARMAFGALEAINPDDPGGANVFEVRDAESGEVVTVDLGGAAANRQPEPEPPDLAAQVCDLCRRYVPRVRDGLCPVCYAEEQVQAEMDRDRG